MKNEELIVFFNGWGMDNNVISHLDSKGYDLLTFANYNNIISIPDINALAYKKKTLVAWSLGVYMASYHLKGIIFDISIAVNGTFDPVNENFGIDPIVFKSTLDNLSEESLLNFYKRITVKKDIFEDFLRIRPQRDFSDLISELEYFSEISSIYELDENIFKKALIGKQDKIFLPKNQNRFWSDKTEIIEINQPHYPFSGYSSWKEFIDASEDK